MSRVFSPSCPPVVSRAMALVGFPGQRRFSLKSLAEAVEPRGFAVRRKLPLPGLLPLRFVSAQAR